MSRKPLDATMPTETLAPDPNAARNTLSEHGAASAPASGHGTETAAPSPDSPRSARSPISVGDGSGPPSGNVADGFSDPAWRLRHDRYYDLGQIRRGGQAEVRRVRDHALGRVVAMKMLPWDVVDSGRIRQRFLDEMRTTAALQHPGIVPVHDSGELPDGRLWFTMKEVRGITLRAAIEELHSHSERWTLRRLVEVFARACEAVSYAHSRGVVHRDLKPENMMIGEFGEVLVMDWGLVKNLRIRKDASAENSVDLDSIDSVDESLDPMRTLPGDVMGTPAYMAPEQARGKMADRRSDIYALGAVLYEILSGRPPFLGTVRAVYKLVREGVAPPPPVTSADSPVSVPEELVAVVTRAMAKDPADRFADCETLGNEVRSWLDGTHKHDRAMALVEEARRIAPKLEELLERAKRLEKQARDQLGKVPSHAPASEKVPSWALQDRAAALRREAAVEEVGWFQTLRSALNEVPDLRDAHELLADYYRARLAAAEESREMDAAAQYEALLRVHDRGTHAAFINGRASVTLVTNPPNARVSLYKYEEIDRVLTLKYVGELGASPLLGVALAKGSYVLNARAPGYTELVYPVFVGRGEHWSGIAPGEDEPRAIALLKEGELGPDDVYIPAGFFIAGGDKEAAESLPRMRVWCEAFVARRYPVTNREYLEFLNDLVTRGRAEEALVRCPRGGFGRANAIVYTHRADGFFELGSQAQAAEQNWPVAFVDWHNAVAYASWLAEKTGLSWRLLNELEWEKAARGVDGRLAPWGDHVDTAFACMLGSREVTERAEVSSFPVDQSPYGVCGMAGNVRDWCINEWKPDGPRVENGVVQVDAADPTSDEIRSARGGTWTSAPMYCRVAARFADKPTWRFGGVGFRLARSL
ncbi:MAG: SUMF1/EgtB/PvdO family nonheme iron enzyme [Polyangiaceae bacterium]|nr:SUMF1/EgtB/PvdO family nonheme iron enzyme [Polyangiaceae bacterium]